jgi:Transposase DDE domain group 1
MQTECSQDSCEFASPGSRRVTAAFDGGAITSNAGALLLREADRGIGLSRQVAACFRDGRRQDRIEHGVETLVAQRIHGIAPGYEDRSPGLDPGSHLSGALPHGALLERMSCASIRCLALYRGRLKRAAGIARCWRESQH